MLGQVYEAQRRITQKGYRILDLRNDPTGHPIFKTLKTVEAWLDAEGAHVRWDNPTWTGYVEYVFHKLSPTIPQPGQLKNKILLKEYLRSSPDLQVKPEKKTSTLEELYRRILRPEIVADPGLMTNLGLRNIRLFEEDPDEVP